MMGKLRRVLMVMFLVLVILIPIVSLAHYYAFPQETRAILVDYSNLENKGRLYFNPSTPSQRVDSLNSVIEQANKRNLDFWGYMISNPKFIYCNTEEEARRYNFRYTDPATTYVKLGSYIIINKDVTDLDVISHEISHAEFGERIGFYHWTFSVPIWFNEGLAMQNDYRDYYSEDSLKVKSDNFKNLPDIKTYITPEQFFGGNAEQVMLNYMTAKYEVRKWYTKEKLNTLIEGLKSGKTFEMVYGE